MHDAFVLPLGTADDAPSAVRLPPVGTTLVMDVVLGGLVFNYSRVRGKDGADLEPLARMRMGQLCTNVKTSGIDNSVAKLTLTIDSVVLEDRRYVVSKINTRVSADLSTSPAFVRAKLRLGPKFIFLIPTLHLCMQGPTK